MTLFGWLFLTVVAVVLLFGFVLLFGAPYLPTLKARTTEALDMLALKPGQTLLELGCGDGRVLRAAAERGITAIGYELNPLLVVYARLRSVRYGRRVQVKWGNYWHKSWPQTDGIYVFLLDRFMAKLDKKITQEISRDVKVVSFAFKIPNKRPSKELHGLVLYEYHHKAPR